jgi:dihydroorotate dehydrogenase electron transfer subunit
MGWGPGVWEIRVRSPDPTTLPAAARPVAVRSLARVVGNHALGSLHWLALEAPGWPGARPGQFALLQPEGSRCFLSRALSVSKQEHDVVSFLIAPVGGGTRELCALDEGEQVWVLGPLGNGFDVNALTAGQGRLLIVAGGVGVAPFPLLLSSLQTEGAGVSGAARLEGSAARGEGPATQLEVVLLLGFRDVGQAVGAQPLIDASAAVNAAPSSSRVACRTLLVTEDGAFGSAEKVSDALRREIRPNDRLAVCGPPAMAEAVWAICAETLGVRAWFSLEAGMACGVGSCHGCVIPLVGGGTARVCREGPVFEGAAVFYRDGGPDPDPTSA